MGRTGKEWEGMRREQRGEGNRWDARSFSCGRTV